MSDDWGDDPAEDAGDDGGDWGADDGAKEAGEGEWSAPQQDSTANRRGNARATRSMHEQTRAQAGSMDDRARPLPQFAMHRF